MAYEKSARKLQKHMEEIKGREVAKAPDLSTSDEEYEEGKVMDLLDYEGIKAGEVENPDYSEDDIRV